MSVVLILLGVAMIIASWYTPDGFPFWLGYLCMMAGIVSTIVS